MNIQKTRVVGTKNIGGWLYVVGFGVVIAPVYLAVTTFPVYLALPEMLHQFQSLGARIVLILEACFDVVYFFACLYVIRLFFQKHHLFPLAFIVISIANLFFKVLDGFLVSVVLGIGTFLDHFKIVLPTLIGVAIWVPYILRSKRVKETFVVGGDA